MAVVTVTAKPVAYETVISVLFMRDKEKVLSSRNSFVARLVMLLTILTPSSSTSSPDVLALYVA